MQEPEIAHRMGIELTETAIVQDIRQAQAWIDLLRARGCRFALDDFGIGFNSFGYLQTLQFDELKIDGSFVRTCVEDPKMRALIGALHAMAESLHLETVAEWVESRAILEVVADLGLTYALRQLAPKVLK